MARNISEQRQTAYYLGIGLMIVGGLLFASTFVTIAMHFGDFADFDAIARSVVFRWVAGMALLIVGGFVRNVAARGLAGSGVVLDPQQAREDLEPFTRMAGGMVKDALDEAEIKIGSAPSEKVVMVKCSSCGTLNEEDAKFCKECGGKL